MCTCVCVCVCMFACFECNVASHCCVEGAKEFNLAATVEYLRDNRPGMVQPKVSVFYTVNECSKAIHKMKD